MEYLAIFNSNVGSQVLVQILIDSSNVVYLKFLMSSSTEVVAGSQIFDLMVHDSENEIVYLKFLLDSSVSNSENVVASLEFCISSP